MFRWIRFTIALLGIIPGPSSFGAEHPSLEFFERQVRPLLVKHCYRCHAGEKSGGGLSLETASGWRTGGESGPAIVPGVPEKSLLIEAINYRSLEMPPADQGGKLTPQEIATLTEWIQQGAVDPRDGSELIGGMNREQAASWWSFQPLPDVTSTPTSSQIDTFVQSRLAQQGLTAGPIADKRTLIRRATYDLTGLPPAAEEVDAFLSDHSDQAFEKVIDRLLESPQYGIHWGRHWLDVVRYADTAGENTDRPLPHAWRYRNWVLDAFNRDLSFDAFASQQIAGDIITATASKKIRAEGIIATGYLAISRRFGHDIDKDMHLTYEDVIDNLGKNFLGLTLGCARCHDHKYDPVTSEDYYALYGVFASTRFAFPGCEPKGQPRDLVPLIADNQVNAMMTKYREQLAQREQRSQAIADESQRLKQIAAASSRLLAESPVGEGASVSLHDGSDKSLDNIEIRKGEVLQLTVFPNGNYGADTTQVELEISQRNGQRLRWNVLDLIPKFADGGPAITHRGATWCLLDVTDGPMFLQDRKVNVDGQESLRAWSRGDTPSALVNASKQPVSVWTTLPGESFFVHPGQDRNVAVAWVCPDDGQYRVRGAVTDAHPAGLDGVAFRLDLIASSDFGSGLVSIGEITSTPTTPLPQPPDIPVAYAVIDADAHEARLHQRGDPEQLGDEIPRRWLSTFGGQSLALRDTSGRQELAQQIVEHPLFARVMANRIWQWHFGRGLVATANDFGSRGESPSHPDLLDWLASQFRAGGYRIKPLHRLIMMSDTYQRSSISDRATIHRDPENRWLARFSRRRLTAEEIRDSLMTAGGNLELTFNQAHPFPPESDWKFTQHDPFNAIYDSQHRSVFLMVQRQRRHPYLALFDGADPNSSTADRQSTTVPTQALYFLNDPFFHEQAARCADRLDPQAEESARVRAMFRRLLQREPSQSEAVAAKRFLAQYPGEELERWSAYTRVLMSSNEFLYVD